MQWSPISEGEFPSGSEWMLWRPGLNRRRLRWRAIRCSTSRTKVGLALVGIGLACLALRDGPRSLDWLLITFIILITALSVLGVAVDYHCADYDHRHRPDRPCFMEDPGRFFYRASDFRDLPSSTVDAVCRVVTVVRAVHTSPAAAWLDPGHLRDVHCVAWETLRVLEASRPLRHALADVRSRRDVDLTGDVATARSSVAAVDDALDRVVTCLLQTEALLRSWEQKLVDIELRTRIRADLDLMPPDPGAAALRRAESVVVGVFATITAARDLTDAGPFPWERPLRSSPSSSVTPPPVRHGLEQGGVP